MEVPDASIILNRLQIWDLADAGDDGKLDLGLLLSPQAWFGNIIHEHADEEVVFLFFVWNLFCNYVFDMYIIYII